MKLYKLNLFLFPHVLLIALMCYILLPFNLLHFHIEARQAEIQIVSFAVLSVISLLILPARIFLGEGKAYSITLVDFSFVLYCAYLAIQLGLYQNTDRPESIIEGLSLLLLYFVIRQLDKDWGFWVFVIILLSGVFQFFYGIYQLPVHVPITEKVAEIYGSYQNTGIFGGAVAVSLTVLLAMLVFKRKMGLTPSGKWGLVILLVFYGFVLVSTGSRAAVVSVILAGSYLFFLKHKHWFFIQSTGKRRSWSILFVSLVIAILGALYLLRAASVKGRFFIWGRGVDMIMDNFWFGFGHNGFMNNYMLYQANFIKHNPQNPLAWFADDNLFAFNEWLRIFAEQGMIGVLLLGGLAFLIVRTLHKAFNKKNGAHQTISTVIASSLLLSVSVFSCFSYPLYYFQFKVLLTVAIATIAGGRVPTNGDAVRAYKIENNKVLNISLCFIVLMAVLPGISFGKQQLGAFDQWNKAGRNLAFDKKGALEQFESCHRQLSGCVSFLNMYGAVLCSDQHWEEAIGIYTRSLTLVPSYNATVGLGKAYAGINCTQKAMMLWNEAAFMIPTRVEPRYLIMKQQWFDNDSVGFYENYELLKRQKIKIPSLKVRSMFFELSNLKFNQTNKK
jgi:hypothetical protein